MDNILASSISNKEFLTVFDKMVKERLLASNDSALTPGLFSIVPVEMLPYLAKQWDVLGFNGWRYADTEAKQRALIANAIELHKYKGTVWAIREALKLIGINDVTILRGTYEFYYNDEVFYNGSFSYGGANPFNIQVEVDGAVYNNITEQIAYDMVALILAYKAGRTLLTSVNVKTPPQSDPIQFSDSLSIDVDTSGSVVNYVI